MADYTTHDPRGWCGDASRGAALGRPTVADEDPTTYDGKLGLRRAYLDSGGYDSNGTYFGFGEPLYWCANDDGSVDFMLRAPNRTTARERVLKRYPKARVRR